MTEPDCHYFWDKPVQFIGCLWPDIKLYSKQRMILESLVHNDETFVPAGNMLGKDFISGLACLWFFLTRTPCRIVTTSADYNQLESVLWGEIKRFIQTADSPLTVDKGGPLVVNHLHIRKGVIGHDLRWTGDIEGLSYLQGRVAAKGEGLLGHHIADTGDGIPRTLAVIDEASGVEDVSYERMTTWAKRLLAIGNCYTNPTGANFFEKLTEQGDVART